MKISTSSKIYIIAGAIILAIAGIAIYKHNRPSSFKDVLYSAENMQKAMDNVPVWMRGFPEIKKIADNMDAVIQSQYQHNCIGNDRPLDKVDCDSLNQRRDSLNKKLQDEIHTLNLQNKSQAIIDTAIANIKNLREDQTLQIQLKDILDNPYSEG